MKVLVVGGTGFISGEIVRLSLAAGHEVVLLNRGRSAPQPDLQHITGDAERLGEFRPQIRDLGPDIVVHSVAMTEAHAAELVAATEGLGTRLLVLGSQDCYDAFQQMARARELHDFPVDEDAPTSTITYYYRGKAVGPRSQDYDKNLMTGVLLAAWRRGAVLPTVFRCPMVYGPRDPQFRFRHGEIIRRLLDRRRLFTIGQAAQNHIWPFGFVTNVAAAIVHSFGRPITEGKCYNIGETRFRTRRLWATSYARAADFEFDFAVLPDELLAGDPSGRNHPPANMIADCTRFGRDTGFVEPVSLGEAVRLTLEWGLAHPEDLGPEPDYDREERLVACYAATMEALHARAGLPSG